MDVGKHPGTQRYSGGYRALPWQKQSDCNFSQVFYEFLNLA
jgi:hypothetical protein